MYDNNIETFANIDSHTTPTSPYFVDRLFTDEEQRQIRNHDAFRFAADIIARTNSEYRKYIHHGDMRLRIIHKESNSTLILGDVSGLPMAKVYINSNADGSQFVYRASTSIKERGADTDTISSMKMGVAIKSLFSVKGRNMPRVLDAMRSSWESHSNIIYHNVNYSNPRLLMEHDCKRPEGMVNLTRDMADFLLQYHEHAGDNPPMPTVEVLDQIKQQRIQFDLDRNFYNRACELADEAYGSERWMVIRAEAGFIIGKFKADPNYILDKVPLSQAIKITQRFVFVRKFEDLAVINPDMHEQFMGAYVMMRAAEPRFGDLNRVYNCSYVPFADKYMKNTHTVAYFSSSRFDGGVSLSFRALA